MKAMVLAAGLGLRMRPLTGLRAKPALPVLNQPLLARTLEFLALHGFKDVVVNTHHLPASVREAAQGARGLGLRVRFSHEREILGTGGGLRRARGLLGPGPVLVVNGDVLFDFDLRALARRHRASGAAATLALKANPDPSRYSPVVTGPDGRIRSVAGLPCSARGPVSLFTGVHVVEAGLFDRLRPGFSDSVRDLYVPLLAEGERLTGVRVRGAWYDLGTPALYLDAQMRLLPRNRRGLIHDAARIEAGGRVVRSVVGPGCVVAAGATVRDSVLWDGVTVGARARVRRSILASGLGVPARSRIEGRVGVALRGRARWSKL
jgi:NDP-sugar pyrophosphorylase family protein